MSVWWIFYVIDINVEEAARTCSKSLGYPVMNGYKEMSWMNRNNGLTVTDLTYGWTVIDLPYRL